MTWITIKARDVWLFRDGKPFNGGEDHLAQSLFPPTPFTLQGILRHKISDSLGVTLQQYKKGGSKSEPYIGKHGSLTELGSFSLGWYTLAQQLGDDVLPLFPSPADLLFSKYDLNKCTISVPNQSLLSDAPIARFPQITEDYENDMGYWLSVEAFTKQYLQNKTEICRDRYQKLYSVDSRFGVSTDSSTSYREDGQLYQVGFIRPHPDTRLLISVNDAIPEDYLTGEMIMGGEQRHGESCRVEVPYDFPNQSSVTGNFKVIFLTPSYFDGGWKPKSEDGWSRLFNEFNGDVELVSAALYRPTKIGGWDNHRRQPRTMNHYVTPGSVYYFTTSQTITLPPFLTHNPAGVDAGKLGFGRYAITTWSSEKDT